MRTQEFIEKYQGVQPDNTKWCSSVMLSTNGNFYSYGLHYPLLFRFGSYWLVNTSGYSVTTSKHIGWARDCADFEVKLNGSDLSAENILKSLEDELVELDKAMAKGQKGSRAYEIREDRFNEVRSTIQAIRG